MHKKLWRNQLIIWPIINSTIRSWLHSINNDQTDDILSNYQSLPSLHVAMIQTCLWSMWDNWQSSTQIRLQRLVVLIPRYIQLRISAYNNKYGSNISTGFSPQKSHGEILPVRDLKMPVHILTKRTQTTPNPLITTLPRNSNMFFLQHNRTMRHKQWMRSLDSSTPMTPNQPCQLFAWWYILTINALYQCQVWYPCILIHSQLLFELKMPKSTW